VADLAGLVLRVHRDDRGTRSQDAVVRRDELRQVRQVDADAVARLDARVGERLRELARPVPERLVGYLVVLELDRRLLRMVLYRLRDVSDEIRHHLPQRPTPLK